MLPLFPLKSSPGTDVCGYSRFGFPALIRRVQNMIFVSLVSPLERPPKTMILVLTRTM